ncbi:MAG: tetraacyldisaccharide 4'-kinase [Hyphomicrobiales bacterium]|nr:tetraacyldisaccharide 4'-kinase [Hyphomicrobiales bacterium]
MIAPRFWARERPNLAALALAPFGALYGAATARRMARPGARVGAPVVCVGNFVLGGAGKTPTAIALARILQGAGERVAFLSRGYGGARRPEPIRVDPAVHSARAVGDEPLLLARVADCFVAADRLAAAREAIAQGASALVLDDGLQNPSLAKDFSLAVVDGEARFGNGLCFPAGPLRAPPARQIPFVSAQLVIGGPPNALARLRALAPEKPMLRATLEADAVAAAALIGQPVLAFAGIARPEKFFATLEGLGARVAARRSFPDHHVYEAREIDALLAEAAARGLTPVTTEKDHVRLAYAYRQAILALPVTLRFEAPARLAALLAEALAKARGR